MKNKWLIIHSGIIVCLFVFIVIDELFWVSHDYLLETIIALYIFGTTIPLQVVAHRKSKEERSRLIKASSFVFLSSMLSVVLFLQMARGQSFGWAFFRIVAIILVSSAINLKVSLMSIWNSSKDI